ncbi:FecR family protein [Puia sp. P3]|uniref:FecR family protein n=1 Tax=Puia sp. P3 TaxID=3423952 RepID=UPI003D66CFC4
MAGRYKNDLVPGRDKAVLKLSDGREVELNGTVSGGIANQDGAAITEDNGWLKYSASGEAHYNDLYTPVGAQIKVVLADGTKVWLDAGSSIHYPTAFPSGNREVTITGQAYFEVAANARQPFIVHAKDQTIRVLGTHFNVNAYGAAAAKTTLEQGSVLVSSGSAEVKLEPGQQTEGGIVKNGVDLEEVLAWKNGEFRFNGASIAVIMDQLARWYGAEVRYKDDIREEFVAKIPRNVPISKVLKYLEATGQVKFAIDGNVITVMR